MRPILFYLSYYFIFFVFFTSAILENHFISYPSVFLMMSIQFFPFYFTKEQWDLFGLRGKVIALCFITFTTILIIINNILENEILNNIFGLLFFIGLVVYIRQILFVFKRVGLIKKGSTTALVGYCLAVFYVSILYFWLWNELRKTGQIQAKS